MATGDDIRARYDALWSELTREEVVGDHEKHRIAARVRRLNELGFDVEELQMDAVGGAVRIQPKVVDAGHHSRRLMRLTGHDVEENQARRLLNDLDAYRAGTGQHDEDEEIVAHEWLSSVFLPVATAVPRDMRGKLEQAEVFHEVLEHRWFLSERSGRDVGITEAVRDYVSEVLVNKPDERAVLGAAAFLNAP
jgi:hypothetical protein